MSITLKHIEIGYASTLFKACNFTLEQGKLYSLIGKNGIGKTTLIQTILGEIKPISGAILIDNKPLNTLTQKDKMKLFSFVPSKFSGVQNLSVRELIGMGRAPFTNILGRLSKTDYEVVDSIIERLQLNKIMHSSTTSISDGERQIAMIGKALAQEASILILDEPTAFLDYTNRLRTLKLLKSLAKEKEILVLFSTHNMALALEYSDEILAIDNTLNLTSYAPKETKKERIVKEVY